MAHRILTAPSGTGMSILDLDVHVRKLLPLNSKITETQDYDTAIWTRAARITVTLEDETKQSFFLKCASGEVGKMIIEGEFDSLKRIGTVCPGLAPTLYGTGKFRDSETPTYFLLMEFLNMETGPPDPVKFVKQLADLHSRSLSPTGQFGYPMITCQGPIAQDVRWHDNWSVFYGRMLRKFFERELDTNGPSKDGSYEIETERLLEQTIPKLLGPLQTHGRILKPSLVHGDLWEENCGTDVETGQPKIFDPAAFYGHNEYEFGMWRSKNVPFDELYHNLYCGHIPHSPPTEQWDDRNKLYAIKFEVTCSALWPTVHEGQREIIMGYMTDLNSKYAKDADTVAGADQHDDWTCSTVSASTLGPTEGGINVC